MERAAEVHTLIAAVFVAVFSPVREHTGSDLTRPRASPSPTTTDRSGSPGAPTTTNHNNNSNYYCCYCQSKHHQQQQQQQQQQRLQQQEQRE